MMRINGLLITALILFILFSSKSGICLWPNDPEQNMPVCVAEGVQEFPFLVKDGSGGVIVTWHDIRNGNRDIYAQRINADGEVLWAKDGMPVYTGEGEQGWPVAVSDGAGGAIVAWMDSRRSIQDIYAQRVDANGKLLWDATGIPVCVDDDVLQEDVMAIPDGSGGVILTWEDWRNGNQDIYTQHLNADGKPVWAKNGVPACKAEGDQYDPSVTTDGKGGAIFAWWDISSSDWNIRAQHLDVNGNSVWGESGIAVCDEPGAQGNPFIASDGAGGAYVVWVDYRNDEMMFTNGDIYVQHLDASGTPLWTKGGIPICDLPLNQQQSTIISDGAGGAIITWWDERDVYSDIYAQRIDSNGKALWQEKGLSVCVAEGLQREPKLVSDGAGGAIIYWNDYRRDYGEQTADDIYVQRINAGGEILWGHNGAAVCTADGQQITPHAIADGEGGIFIAWTDKRNGEEDIYIQRVSFK